MPTFDAFAHILDQCRSACLSRYGQWALRVHVAIAAMAMGVVSDADAQRSRPRPITWCEHPSSNAKWKRQDVVIVISQSEHEHNYTLERGKGADAPRLSDAVVGLILESLVPRFRASTGLPPGQRNRQPSADHRYTPAALRTALDFTLRGDGTLEGFLTAESSDTTLANDLVRALRESGDARELLIDSDSSTRFDFDIWVATSPSGRAWWQAFTLYAPMHRRAEVKRQTPRIRYPDELLGWESSFITQYVVQHDGKARPESITTVPAPDAYAWPTASEREVFYKFIDQVKLAIARWEYTPAEVAGCRVDQLVQQQFSFNR